MPYKFTFDLSKVPKFFFTEVAKIVYKKRVHKRVGHALQDIIKRFRIDEATGLSFSDAVLLLEDFVDMEVRNFLEKERFKKTKRRALFLPHCSRKYMDNRCKAKFDPNIPSYICAHCSFNCLISRAVSIAEGKGYDVYVIPGGSCIYKILKLKRYDGVVGVACGEEVKLAGEALSRVDVAGQAVPLLRNGCANTFFDIETLVQIL
ncbi:MAG: DUF116 domain-containing protein [Candidatus Bathyarchaeia archaeon]